MSTTAQMSHAPFSGACSGKTATELNRGLAKRELGSIPGPRPAGWVPEHRAAFSKTRPSSATCEYL